MSDREAFRGWAMVAVAFLLYGLGMAPAYYSWGFLAPEVIAETGLSREQVGNVFGVFTLTFAAVSPVVAWAIDRVGLRLVVALGGSVAAIGFAWTSVAETADEFLLSYALVGGLGIGACTLLPAQLLPVHWFRRYRARATAIIVVGAGVVGAGVPLVDDWLLQVRDWRFVWRVVAAIVFLVAIFASLLLRTRPEDIGQRPDGVVDDGHTGDDAPSATRTRVASQTREPREAGSGWATLRTYQFPLVTFACLANTVPWRVLTAHGRLHFEDLGFASSVAAAILGVRVGMSAIGRLGGAVGDFVDPRYVLAFSLWSTAIGLYGLSATGSTTAAYTWIALLGFTYGLSFTSEPLVLAHVLGSRAFATSNGLRLAITGVLGWLAPRWAGAAADRAGSYQGSFEALAGVCLLGGISLMFCRRRRSSD